MNRLGILRIVGGVALATVAGLSICGESNADWFDRWKAGRHVDKYGFPVKPWGDPCTACSLIEVGEALDAIEEGIRDDGTVVIKQPDIWGQARMTRYRRDFDTEMKNELDAFKTILSARVARSDQATFQQTTALGFALAGKKKGTVVGTPAAPEPTGDSALTAAVALLAATPPTEIDRTGSFELMDKALANLDSRVDKLGIEPTVYLNQKQRYLDHLNEIRRVNLGDDVADSAGYALYLIRMPVSILPGGKTERGFGAELDATAKHQFDPGFLHRTYRNLVINDLVDKLAPIVYEAIRSGSVEKLEEDRIVLAESEKTIRSLEPQSRFYPLYFREKNPNKAQSAEKLGAFIETVLDPKKNGGFIQFDNIDNIVSALATDLESANNLKEQVEKLNEFARKTSLRIDLGAGLDWPYLPPSPTQADILSAAEQLLNLTKKIDCQGIAIRDIIRKTQTPNLQLDVPFPACFNSDNYVSSPYGEGLSMSIELDRKRETFITRTEPTLTESKLPSVAKDVMNDIAASSQAKAAANNLYKSSANLSAPDSQQWANLGYQLENAEALLQNAPDAIRSKQDNLSLLNEIVAARLEKAAIDEEAKIVEQLAAQATQRVNAVTNRLIADLEQIKKTASIGQHLSLALSSGRVVNYNYPIAPSDYECVFLEKNLETISKSTMNALATKRIRGTDVRAYLQQELEAAYDLMSGKCGEQQAVLDDVAFIEQIVDAFYCRRFCNPIDGIPGDFDYRSLESLEQQLVERLPGNVKGSIMEALCWTIAVDAGLLNRTLIQDMKEHDGRGSYHCTCLEELQYYYVANPTPDVEETFNKYVEARWPLVVFALDPTADDQNIADALSLRRDLQLAVSYALASGNLSMSQVNRFQRRLELESETIALNRTVTAYVHGNDHFGWRFAPRFQNPPLQGNNLVVFSNLLTGRLPERHYRLKHSRIEPGLRELTMVAVLPSFLERIRMDVAGNWFRLNHPDAKLVSTKRMLEQGQRVRQLNDAITRACDTGCYRPQDVEGIAARIVRAEAMLPMQTEFVPVPYENTQGGFDLFGQGSSSLVPQLVGFEGAEGIAIASATTTPTTTGSTAAPAPAPDVSHSYFLYGKNFSLVESKVVAGGCLIEPDVLSREVAVITIPAKNLLKTVMIDGIKEHVEIHLATPNGISNRVLLPLYDKEAKVEQAAPFTLKTASFAGQICLKDNAWHDATDPKKGAITVAATAPLGFSPNIAAEVSLASAGIGPIEIPSSSITLKDNANEYQICMKSVVERIAACQCASNCNSNSILGKELEATIKVIPILGNGSTKGPATELKDKLKFRIECSSCLPDSTSGSSQAPKQSTLLRSILPSLSVPESGLSPEPEPPQNPCKPAAPKSSAQILWPNPMSGMTAQYSETIPQPPVRGIGTNAISASPILPMEQPTQVLGKRLQSSVWPE